MKIDSVLLVVGALFLLGSPRGGVKSPSPAPGAFGSIADNPPIFDSKTGHMSQWDANLGFSDRDYSGPVNLGREPEIINTPIFATAENRAELGDILDSWQRVQRGVADSGAMSSRAQDIVGELGYGSYWDSPLGIIAEAINRGGLSYQAGGY